MHCIWLKDVKIWKVQFGEFGCDESTDLDPAGWYSMVQYMFCTSLHCIDFIESMFVQGQRMAATNSWRVPANRPRRVQNACLHCSWVKQEKRRQLDSTQNILPGLQCWEKDEHEIYENLWEFKAFDVWAIWLACPSLILGKWLSLRHTLQVKHDQTMSNLQLFSSWSLKGQEEEKLKREIKTMAEKGQAASAQNPRKSIQ